MKRFIVLFLILALLLAACGGNTQNANNVNENENNAGRTDEEREPPIGEELTKIRLPMGYIPSVQYSSYYMAVEKGYYAEAGFEVEFDYSFETDGVALVGAGELPFAIVSAEQVLLAREQEIPVVYVMAWFQDFPITAIAKAETGIETPEDLADQTIGLPGLFGASYIGMRALLNSAGLEEGVDVRLEAIGFNQVEALAAGGSEVVIGYLNNEPIQLRAQGYDVNVIPVRDYMQLPANGIITNEALLAEDPDMVARFVEATLRGLADAINDPEEAYQVSLNFVEGLADSDYDVQMEVLNTTIEFWKADTLGFSDVTAWENLQEVLLDMELLSAPQDLEQAFTNEFIK